MEIKKRVAIYARVSTREQTTENQLQDLRKYSEARGWQVIGEFVDHALSGAKDDRPQLREVMDKARRRKIDVLLVWRFDRFARSLKQLINTLEELNELGVHFVSFSEALDTSTSQGRLVFSVVGAIAEFERSLIKERVMAGLRRAKAQGKALGRRKLPFDAPLAFKMRQEGCSLSQIASQLGVGKTTIHRLFQNPIQNSALGSVEASQV